MTFSNVILKSSNCHEHKLNGAVNYVQCKGGEKEPTLA